MVFNKLLTGKILDTWNYVCYPQVVKYPNTDFTRKIVRRYSFPIEQKIST